MTMVTGGAILYDGSGLGVTHNAAHIDIRGGGEVETAAQGNARNVRIFRVARKQADRLPGRHR